MRGLIGSNVVHSFSKDIHERLRDENYYLLSLNYDEVKRLLIKKDFDAINVTIPYKEYVMDYVDVLSAKAKRLGACNTIVNRKGILYGYNTDYYGFGYMIVANCLNIVGKKILIIGKGGASKAIEACLMDSGAKEIIYLTRSKRDDCINYDEIEKTYDVDIIVNCSPMGMIPNIDQCDIDLDNYPNCKLVIDIVYNPLTTKIMLEAKKRGIKVVGGLEMLVAQAYMSSQLFDENSELKVKIDDVVDDVLKTMENIVLIGMPYNGKTSLGKELASMTNRPLYDVDELIENLMHKSVKEIFRENGEAEFRIIEKQIVSEVSRNSGAIIVCGGGVVKDMENVEHLQQNGRLVWIKREANDIEFNDNRPLSASLEDYLKLWEQRKDLYEKYSSYIIENKGPLKDVAMEVIEKW